MAKEEKGKWVTIKGTQVFIKEGQSVSDAFKERAKYKPKKESKAKSNYEKFLKGEKKGDPNKADVSFETFLNKLSKEENIDKDGKKLNYVEWKANQRANAENGNVEDKSKKHWSYEWAKENKKTPEELYNIQHASLMYEEGDITKDELQEYFKDRNEMQSYLYKSKREDVREYFFGDKAKTPEYEKKKQEMLDKEDKSWGDPMQEINRRSAERFISLANSDSAKKQLEDYKKDYQDGYQTENIKDTESRIKNLNEYSATAKYISDGGEQNEAYDRKKYGDEKVDTALFLENDLMRRGYNNIRTQYDVNGMINDRNHTDMIITADMPEKNIAIAYNFNEKGESTISVQGMPDGRGVYGTLIINEKNMKELRDITSGSSLGGYEEFKEYIKPQEPKLNGEEQKTYYDKLDKYYNNRDNEKNYNYEEYAKKIRNEIIKKRG